jgi:hypothetical protein
VRYGQNFITGFVFFWCAAENLHHICLINQALADNKKHVPSLSLKPVCDTRWESKIESVKAITYQTSVFRNALMELMETIDDPKTKSEASRLAEHELDQFEFLISLVMWHDLLFAVNAVSKMLQDRHVQLDVAVKHLRGFIAFLQRYRDTGFAAAQTDAKAIAEELGITPTFKPKRVARRKIFFEYENVQQTNMFAEEVFRTD